MRYVFNGMPYYSEGMKISCGDRTRTCNLRVMSPTSYHCSTPRCSICKSSQKKHSVCLFRKIFFYGTRNYKCLFCDVPSERFPLGTMAASVFFGSNSFIFSSNLLPSAGLFPSVRRPRSCARCSSGFPQCPGGGCWSESVRRPFPCTRSSEHRPLRQSVPGA